MVRDGEACVSPMCLVDSFEDKLGLWDIGVPDRMLGPGWGLGPRVRTGVWRGRRSAGRFCMRSAR